MALLSVYCPALKAEIYITVASSSLHDTSAAVPKLSGTPLPLCGDEKDEGRGRSRGKMEQKRHRNLTSEKKLGRYYGSGLESKGATVRNSFETTVLA